MAPPRSRNTHLGKLLRLARARLGLGQHEFGSLAGVGARAVSRWENGLLPPKAKAALVLDAVHLEAPELHDELALALGFELRETPDDDALTVADADPVTRDGAAIRAELDALVLAFAEEHDVLPRHLRTFGVALLEHADRRALHAREAAEILAAPARAKKANDASEDD